MPRNTGRRNKGARTDFSQLEEELHSKISARNPRPTYEPSEDEAQITEEEFEYIAT